MKVIPISLLFLFSCLHAQVLADRVPSEIAPSVQKHADQIKALDDAKAGEILRLRASYLESLASQEKSASSRGNLDETAALLKLRALVEKQSPEADSPMGISSRQLKEYNGYMDGVTRIEEAFSPKYDQVDSDYLKALAAIEQKLPADSSARHTIADLKESLLIGGSAGGSRTLTSRHFANTEWYWLEGKNKIWRFLPAGKLVTESGEASHFGWRITGPRNFVITAGGADHWSFTMNFDKMRADGEGPAKGKILTFKGNARR